MISASSVCDRCAELAAPAVEGGEQVAQRRARARRDLVGLDHLRRGVGQRNAAGARPVVQQLHRRLADAAARRVDDALEGEVVGGLRHHAEIGERVADLLALVEARAADDAIVEAERDEAVLEGAHLERGAHQDRHLVQRHVPLRCSCSISSPTARASCSASHDEATVTRDRVRVAGVGEQRLAEPALVVGDQVRGGAEDVRGRAVVALQPDDLGAGKILLEAQDVVDLRAAPAIDRLVVVADAADVAALPCAPAAAARDTARRWCPGTRRPACSGSGRDSRRARRHCARRIAQRLQQQVAEVGGVQHLQPRLVGGVELLARALRRRRARPPRARRPASARGSSSGRSARRAGAPASASRRCPPPG